MSVFFLSTPPPDMPELAELWHLLENDYFGDAMDLAESICRDPNAPIEFFCGLSLAYGECGYYEEAEQTARAALGFGEMHWRARHALAVALMHKGRLLGALDTLGFHRTPPEVYVIRAQIEKMGGYVDSLAVTLEDALDQSVPPAIRLYLAYLYGALSHELPGWKGEAVGFAEVMRLGDHLPVWERDAARHQQTAYGKSLQQHIQSIRRVLASGGR